MSQTVKGRASPVEQIATRQGVRPFHHRGTEADLGVLRQTFGGIHPQEFARRLGQAQQAMLAAGKRPLIIDAGANIGATALRFATLYPRALVVSIEPHPGNVALLRRNTEGLAVEVMAAAIGPAPGETRILNPDASEWAFQTGTDGEGPALPVIGVRELIAAKKAEGCAPFIFKCDIEGAEAALFGPDSDWFDEFAMVSVEIHDWLFPDRPTSPGFLQAHARTRRALLVAGENLLSFALPATP